MNLKEGTRRLAVLLGAVGVIVGGFGAYVELQSALGQRARHIRFQQLSNSDVVTHAKSEQSAPDTAGQPDDWQTVSDASELSARDKADLAKIRKRLPAGDQRRAKIDKLIGPEPSTTPSQERATEWKALNPEQRELALSRMTQEQKKTLATDLEYQDDAPAPTKFDTSKYTTCSLDGSDCYTQPNNGGIKTIHWTKDYSVYSIETEDGLTLYPTPAPSLWAYLLAGLLPILGFFVPWGTVRAIGWVGAGFSSENVKSPIQIKK